MDNNSESLSANIAFIGIHLTTISFDDGSGEYSFSINDAVQSGNLSNESEYHIRRSDEEEVEEVVINRFTGTLEASYQRLMDAWHYWLDILYVIVAFVLFYYSRYIAN